MYGNPELETVSEVWPRSYDVSSTMIPNVSSVLEDEEHICKLILYKEIKDSRVRIWDVIILIPNLLFLLFIVARFNRARLKLRATSSPIFLAFYGLVICNIVISVIRCVVSMTVNAAATVGGKADKVLWVTVRFFLLSTEMSVVIFGLAFGHLDSRSSIRRVLLATSFIALAFTITQGTLELVLPDDTFHIPSRDFYVFGHGGMMFWFCSSLVFTTIYLFILVLPWTRLRERLALPTKKSFYIYAGTLATIDLIQSIGAGLLNYTQNPIGLCIVDFTAAAYLTLFTPLVYHTFLSDFFGISQPSIMFSYKAQVDDAMDEDTVSLPHQQSFSSLKTDSDYIYQVHTPSIYVPLYDTQTSKASTSKQRSSLYSLASAKGSKSSSNNVYESQITLYRSSPSTKSLNTRRTNGKGSSDLANYHFTKSDNVAGSRKSSADMQFLRPTWKSNSMSRIKHGAPGSVSNLILSSATASNFIYKPKANDSNVNLYSESRKGSMEKIVTTLTAGDSPRFPPFGKTYSDGNVTSESSPTTSARASLDIPPLEDTLQSILDPKSRTEERGDPSFRNPLDSPGTSSHREPIAPVKEINSDYSSHSSIAPDEQDAQCAASKSFLDTAFLPVRSSLRNETNGSKNTKSGGLNDYLLSLTLRKSKSLPRKDDPSDRFNDSDSLQMQTEYL